MAESVKIVTCSAPVNIAVVKYWGKRDESLILPTNSSISATLSQDQLSTTTTIALSKKFNGDKIWLNGREESIDNNPRLVRCLAEVRRLSQEQHGGQHKECYDGGVRICSINNFPTAAGLASSAAGYACLVYTLSKVFDIEGDVSRIARQGSGSACRSVYGGFVKWEMGVKEDGSDSRAVQLAPASHWPEMEVLVLVVSADKKSVSSTRGMQNTVETSSLMEHRIKAVVPQRVEEMEAAIASRDFQEFGRITMQDSNQFHAVCLDTYPPILYLNDVSKIIIQMVTRYNELSGKIKVAYTFDAGPNAVLYALSSDIPQVLALVCHFFPPNGGDTQYIRGLSSSVSEDHIGLNILQGMNMTFPTSSTGSLQYIIHTKVGDGPVQLDSSKHLQTTFE